MYLGFCVCKPKVFKKTLIHVKKTSRVLLIVNLKVLCLELSKTSIGDQSKAYSKPMIYKVVVILVFSSARPKSSSGYLKSWTGGLGATSP